MTDIRKQLMEQVRACDQYYSIHGKRPGLTVKPPKGIGGPQTPEQRVRRVLKRSGKTKKGLLL